MPTLPWLVHVYTASGAVCALLATLAVFDGNWRVTFLWLFAAAVIDSTDGWFARLARVDEKLPHFSGAKLDDIVDYLTYVFVPALIVWRAELVPAAWMLPIAAAMLLSSAYGFASTDAKTSDHFFTGFPSYWNIVVLYLVVLRVTPVYNAVILCVLSVLVFVRIGYVYPTRTTTWRTLTLTACTLWGLVMLLLIVALPNPPRSLAWGSLAFPIYYFALSVALHVRRPRAFVWIWCLAVVWGSTVSAEPVQVRFPERASRGSLVLKDLAGRVLARGDLVQTVREAEVTVRLVFRFADGSLHDETTVYSQQGAFRLLSYHLVQDGPSFRWTLDMTMNTRDGRVVVRHRSKGGEEEIEDVKLALAADVANGMMPAVLKNLQPARAAASFVAATPEPRPVTLDISAAGPDVLSIDGAARRAVHYVVKAEIGGLAGVLAPLVGKQPPDTHVWIFDGSPPVFAKSEGPLFYGGPIWRIELIRLVSP